MRLVASILVAVFMIVFSSSAKADSCSCYNAGFEVGQEKLPEPFDFNSNIPLECAVFTESRATVPFGQGFVDGWNGERRSEVEFCSAELGLSTKEQGTPALYVRSAGMISGGPTFKCEGENISFNGDCYLACTPREFLFLNPPWGSACVSCPFKASRVLGRGGMDMECFP